MDDSTITFTAALTQEEADAYCHVWAIAGDDSVPYQRAARKICVAIRGAMDIEKAKDALVGISLADHLGDVNNELPTLCAALGLPTPEWSHEQQRFVMAWEPQE